jgi:uridine phosphorylase
VSYPILADKYRLTPLLDAEKMSEFRRKHGGLANLPAPHSALICLYTGVLHHFGWKYPSRSVRGFLGHIYLPRVTGGRVAVLGNFGIGGPAITGIAEEMMAWGVKRIVNFSLAGGLQPDLQPGSIVVRDRAIRDEGTSYHYLPPAREVAGSSQLASALADAIAANGLTCSRGTTWSTDAPHRETREEADLFQGQGVKTVDMESAGLFAAAQVRQRDAASVFVVRDSLAGPRWAAPPDMQALHLRLKTLFDVLLRTLRKMDE